MTHPITPTQVSTIVDLTTQGSHGVESSDHLKQDKWATLEERLRAIEGFDANDPVTVAKIYLVLDVMVSKKFRVP